MTISAITYLPQQEANMGKTRTIIAALAAERSISRRQFEGLCYAEGLSLDTARKIWNGDASVQVNSLETAARVLGVTVKELITEENGRH